MPSASCVGRVERALRAVPGVIASSVNLANKRAAVMINAGTDAALLIKAIVDAGYQANIADAESSSVPTPTKSAGAAKERRHLIWATMLSLPLMAPMLAMPLGRSEEHTSELQSLMRISYAVF